MRFFGRSILFISLSGLILSSVVNAVTDGKRSIVALTKDIFSHEGTPLIPSLDDEVQVESNVVFTGENVLVIVPTAEGTMKESSHTPAASTTTTSMATTVRSKNKGIARFQTLFSSSEHQQTSSRAVLGGFSDGNSSPTRTLSLPSGAKVTYGDIIALAGDFFGNEKRPICKDRDPEDAFFSGFNTLYDSHYAMSETRDILSIIASEAAIVKRSNPPSSAWSSDALEDYDGKYNVATGGGSFASDLFPMGRYLDLALDNFDHFWPHSKIAYEAAHRAAMKQASAASRKGGYMAKDVALTKAYAMNAFADHFLTDMFAAGHMRVPREELQEEPWVSALGDRLSQHMHNEENTDGLNVADSRGNRWKSYGDHKYFNSENAANRNRVLDAVAQSVAEVADSFSSGSMVTSKMSKYYPQPSGSNPVPLFKLSSSGEILRRAKLNDRNYNSFTSSWNPTTTLAKLEVIKKLRRRGKSSVYNMMRNVNTNTDASVVINKIENNIGSKKIVIVEKEFAIEVTSAIAKPSKRRLAAEAKIASASPVFADARDSDSMDTGVLVLSCNKVGSNSDENDIIAESPISINDSTARFSLSESVACAGSPTVSWRFEEGEEDE